MPGALLEVELRKICTTPAHESDSEVKIVKNWRSRDVFWGSKCVLRGRCRDFDTLQNTWQAQEFVRVAKTLAGVGDLKRVWNDAFRVAGAVISRFVMSMFEASVAETVEGLQISCHGSVTLQWSFRVAVTGLGSTFSWQAHYFWSAHLIIVKTYWNSEVKCPVNMSFLKEVSQKCFVFEFQSFIFEGSLAEMFRFWISKLHFWRKSRRNASFLSFKASFLKEVSQKCFVFELHSFNFEGSLAEKLRFWVSKRLFGGSLAEKLCLTKSFESHISWQPNHLNLKSFDIQITWISDQLTTESLESQIHWQPHHLKFKINRQPKSFEARIDWQPKSFESQIHWQPNQLNLKSIDNQNHLNLKSDDNQINWISNQLTTKIIWISNQMTTKSFDSQLVWHQLTFEPIELRTLPSYRFLIFGNFRHRLVR